MKHNRQFFVSSSDASVRVFTDQSNSEVYRDYKNITRATWKRLGNLTYRRDIETTSLFSNFCTSTFINWREE